MKLFLIAAALTLAPVAAQAQVAAATVPNTFDRPATAARAPAQAPAPARAPMATAPANAQSETTLRAIITGAQSGAIDYGLLTDTLAVRVREQEAQMTPLIQGFGALQSVTFIGSQEGADLFAVRFANAATEWFIGFDDAGKVDGLLFRPAE